MQISGKTRLLQCSGKPTYLWEGMYLGFAICVTPQEADSFRAAPFRKYSVKSFSQVPIVFSMIPPDPSENLRAVSFSKTYEIVLNNSTRHGTELTA